MSLYTEKKTKFVRLVCRSLTYTTPKGKTNNVWFWEIAVSSLMIASEGFDPSTFGLWAQHASPAPRCVGWLHPLRGFKGDSPFLVAVYLINDCSAHKLQTICLRELPFSSSWPSASSFEAGCFLSINYNYEKYAVYNLYKSGCVEILSDFQYFSHWRFRTFSVVHLSFQIATLRSFLLPKRFGYLMLLSKMCAANGVTRLLS